MQMEYDALVKLFGDYGWKVDTSSKPLILSKVKIEQHEFLLVAGISGDWVILSAPSFISEPQPSDLNIFLTRLLRLNSELIGTNIGLLENGDISITTYLPILSKGTETFAIVLDHFLETADMLYDELSIFIESSSKDKE